MVCEIIPVVSEQNLECLCSMLRRAIDNIDPDTGSSDDFDLFSRKINKENPHLWKYIVETADAYSYDEKAQEYNKSMFVAFFVTYECIARQVESERMKAGYFSDSSRVPRVSKSTINQVVKRINNAERDGNYAESLFEGIRERNPYLAENISVAICFRAYCDQEHVAEGIMKGFLIAYESLEMQVEVESRKN